MQNIIQDKAGSIQSNSSKSADSLLDPLKNYSKIHHSILEKMSRLELSGLEHQLLNSVIRQTIGYKTDSGINKRITKQVDYLKEINRENTRNNAKALNRAFKTLFDRKILILISTKPFNFKINLSVQMWQERKNNVEMSTKM